MGLLQNIAKLAGLGLKSFGVTWDGSEGWTPIGTAQYGGYRYGGSDIDWRSEAGNILLNSVIGNCAQYIIDKSGEPRCSVVYEDEDARFVPVEKHPCAHLLEYPNAQYGGKALRQALALSFKLKGNAYALKVRGGRGAGLPVELWYIPTWLMGPIPGPNGAPPEFYLYKKPNGRGGFTNEVIPRRNVIHIKNGLNLENPLVGMSPIDAQNRSIAADNEIDNTIALVLKNKGNIGLIISPKQLEEGSEYEVTDVQLREMKRQINEQTTGDARGGAIISPIPVDIDRTTNSPSDLMLDKIGERPEERICSSLGIDPLVIGLDRGGGGQFGAKLKEARSKTYETAIIPCLSAMSEAFTYQLLTDYPVEKVPTRKYFGNHRWVREAQGSEMTGGLLVDFDYSRVKDMQEDSDQTHKRGRDDFKSNIITLNEAREMLGRKPDPNPEIGEKYSFQLVKSTDTVVDPSFEGDKNPDDDTDPSEPEDDTAT